MSKMSAMGTINISSLTEKQRNRLGMVTDKVPTVQGTDPKVLNGRHPNCGTHTWEEEKYTCNRLKCSKCGLVVVYDDVTIWKIDKGKYTVGKQYCEIVSYLDEDNYYIWQRVDSSGPIPKCGTRIMKKALG